MKKLSVTQTYEKIEQNRKNYAEGNFNCIPFKDIKNIDIPGIEQKMYYLISASAGVGKSKLTRSMFIHSALSSNKKVKIFYFSLEESREKIMLSEISKKLWSKFKIRKSIRQLMSIGENAYLTDTDYQKILSVKDEVEKYMSQIEVIDDIRSADKIYKKVFEYRINNGIFENGEYIPNDPEEYVMVVVDHVGLLEVPPRSTLKVEISRLSSIYAIELRNILGCTLVFVQQQAAAVESADSVKAAKLEPSYSNLGEHKLTYQDCDIMISLFNPDRYGITEYKKYKIPKFHGRYRCIIVNKNRYGIENEHLSVLFDPVVETFKELPRSDDKSLEIIYEQLQKEAER
jgi:replicative DNA helicase